ncbi:Ribosome-recycling factor [Chlamydiales bacterium SCGC AG-110-M15]|nr:Ribosome-recycling factor [Chlamydiales bacterium SCGC AG-110-M15]
MAITDESKTKMEAALEHLQADLKGLRTGRANPALLDKVTVEVYGTQMRLKEIATISVPEARLLLVTPFDPNNGNAISNAIEKANLNLQPAVDGNIIRIPIPPMSEDLRKEMVKECKRMGEASKVAIRNTRREGNDTVKKQKSDGDISEDEVKSLEKTIQKFTDDYCKKIDDLIASKEKDILTI